MRRLLLILFFAALAFSGFGQVVRISLLTCAPGDATYSMFGHSAVRVQDPVRGMDMVYNYGTFDFETPNFVWKFMRGKLLYQLDVQSFRHFMREYTRDGRAVYEEEIMLSDADKAALEAFLADNYRPENRYYLYDFFFDNCSSRIRDALETVLGSRLSYRFPEGSEPMTYRQAIAPYTAARPWMALGIDLLLGAPTDRLADERGQMFLPDHLSGHLGKGQVDGAPLLGPRIPLIDGKTGTQTVNQPKPGWLLWALTFIFLLIWHYLPRARRWAGAVFWMLYGLAGCLVAFMWWGTDHQATQENWNIFWLNPLQLVAGIAVAAGSQSTWLKGFGWLQVGMVIIALIAWMWLPQALPLQALPLMLLLAFQSVRLAGLIQKER